MPYMGMSDIAHLYEPMYTMQEVLCWWVFDPDPAYTRLFDVYSREEFVLCKHRTN